jgi:hypothetical protein
VSASDWSADVGGIGGGGVGTKGENRTTCGGTGIHYFEIKQKKQKEGKSSPFFLFKGCFAF